VPTYPEQCKHIHDRTTSPPEADLPQIYYPLLFLGIVGAGGRVVGGNPGHTVYELTHLLAKCSVRYIVADLSLEGKATEAARACSIDTSNLFLFEGHEETLPRTKQSWRGLLQHGESDWEVLDEAASAKTVVGYYSTSGTTGSPKFAAISHAFQILNGEYIEAETARKPYAVSRLVSLPLMHAFAAPLVHLAALRCGTPTYILSRFDIPKFTTALETHHITEFPAVPSMLVSLLSSPLTTRACLASVREVMCAGAALSSTLAASFSALLSAPPTSRLIQLYGATEAGWIASTPWPTSPSDLSTALAEASTPLSTPTPTVGASLPRFSARLVDSASGAPLLNPSPGTRGSLEILAPHFFLYYIGAAQATRDSFSPDGWLQTGDIATADARGRLFIVDRAKDMIKTRGWQVAPAEIEAALGAHPGVADVAVIGVDAGDASLDGEVAWAFVVVTGDAAAATELRLTAYLRARLAAYKLPARFLFVPDIPKGPSGKILRRVLKERHVASEEPKAVAVKPVAVAVAAAQTVPVEAAREPGMLGVEQAAPAWCAAGSQLLLHGWPETEAWSVCEHDVARGRLARWARMVVVPAAVGFGFYLLTDAMGGVETR